ncbi:aminoacyl-histidine dipeptidase [Peptostreptococcus equinus]|uniref:Aminoacyl-histidine dipeptidase n=1 Tax=Peptostreptococcus equinus TaxID=3003601 RepID=A0ABY7JPM6_9FIRM|nr:aminoacyl-histidine dipeptidase [Peptostreptococcus sp. CBA3647]WAW15324.1 aminoacyl-histidine dipeptidase [Peptostreptococcus sp. CBA3647]
MDNLSNLEPKEVFKWFYELNQIPRSSGNEKAATDFVLKFAEERGLEAHRDELLNVIVKKPGTVGYEKSEPVIIQGHIDMVCVKADDSNHNFDTDPIEMIVDGDLLKANKTTLGGDDGIAVAMGLALLDSNDIPHPPLEILITTNEETGMDGAMALKADYLTGKRLINLDTEEEKEFLVSCSGGSNIDISFDIEKEAAKDSAYKIVISGLKGGHSGAEIILQRANAIKLEARLLNSIRNSIRLASIEGGIKHNAIPSNATAKFTSSDFDKIKETLNELIDGLKEEYRVEEPGLKIEISDCEIEEVYVEDLSNRIIDFLMMLPDGVQYMSKDIDGLVQTSLNNAIIGEKDSKLVLTTSVRSASTTSLRELLNVLTVISQKSGAKTREYAAYPAWQFDAHSPLREKAIEVFEKQYGEEPKINSIHAGLECGLFKNIMPDTDMLSYGPQIRDAHTPLENMSISSVERVWKFTKALLGELK